VSYRLGPNAADGLNVARRTLGSRLADVEQMIEFFQPFDTQTMEQWATVHQVWADQRRRGVLPVRESVLTDVLAWKGGKRGFDERSITRTLHAMEQAGMVELANK
jgi:hypothetical protein